MTLTELRYIVAVARERHFGRAAEACFVSQPTLSVAVRKLEEELGITLFERRSNEISVTSAGEAVVAQAQRVLEEASALKELAQGGRNQLTGPLRIGLIHTVGPYLLPHLVPIVRENAPDMPLIIEEGYTQSLSRRLRNGELDVVILSLPFEEPSIVTQPVYEEPFVILLPAAHPWNKREEIPGLDLAQESVLMLGRGHCFRDQVLKICPECAQTSMSENNMQMSLEGSSLETIRHMVASGVGITVLPCTAAGADRFAQRLLTIRRFAEPIPTRRIALAWRKSFTRPAAVDAIRQAIRACRLTCLTMLESPERDSAEELRPAPSVAKEISKQSA